MTPVELLRTIAHDRFLPTLAPSMVEEPAADGRDHRPPPARCATGWDPVPVFVPVSRRGPPISTPRSRSRMVGALPVPVPFACSRPARRSRTSSDHRAARRPAAPLAIDRRSGGAGGAAWRRSSRTRRSRTRHAPAAGRGIAASVRPARSRARPSPADCFRPHHYRNGRRGVPPVLWGQLKDRGRLVALIGSRHDAVAHVFIEDGQGYRWQARVSCRAAGPVEPSTALAFVFARALLTRRVGVACRARSRVCFQKSKPLVTGLAQSVKHR